MDKTNHEDAPSILGDDVIPESGKWRHSSDNGLVQYFVNASSSGSCFRLVNMKSVRFFAR